MPASRIRPRRDEGDEQGGLGLRKALPPTSGILPLAFEMRRAVQSRVLTEPPPIDPELREELIEGYKEDILRLQELIGRDLSIWLR